MIRMVEYSLRLFHLTTPIRCIVLIIRKRAGLFTLLFAMRGSVVPRIMPQILLVSGFALLVAWVHSQHSLDLPEFTLTPFTLLGVALSLFLGFRNNAAYDRWWEGRKLWGELVYETRALARITHSLFGKQASERRQLLMLMLAFSHSLRHQLRPDTAIQTQLQGFIGQALAETVLQQRNPADAVLRQMNELIAHAYQQQRLDSIALGILDQHLTRLAHLQAGLERLHNTPLPFAFSLLVHRTAYLYCFLLPFGLVGTANWLTPVFASLVAYAFFGLDALSEELESPFDDTGLNHLPLSALCRVNEISVAEALDEPAPEPLQPIAHFLS